MPRYFTLQQAQDLLTEVKQLLRDAVEARAVMARAEGELREAAGRVQMLGGVRLDPTRMTELGRARERSAQRIQECLERISDLGVQVKDLDEQRLSFSITLEDQVQPDDEAQVVDGLTVAIPAASAARMKGITMDFQEPDGFKFHHSDQPHDLRLDLINLN